jgi:hypothetical protein
MITGEELKTRFQGKFSDMILRYLAQHVHNAYPDSCEWAAALDREFKRRLIPQLRHFIIQSRVRHIAKHFPHVTGTVRRSAGAEPYTVLRIDNFSLTISMVKEPGKLPPWSDFRRDNSGLNLFSEVDPDEEEEYYAILTHVPTWDNSAPEHMAVVFPYDDYSGTYASMDLNPLIAFNLAGTTPVVDSEIIDLPEPILRMQIPKLSEEA